MAKIVHEYFFLDWIKKKNTGKQNLIWKKIKTKYTEFLNTFPLYFENPLFFLFAFLQRLPSSIWPKQPT